MASMVRIDEMETNMSVLKDAIREWFHALTSEIAAAGSCRVSRVPTKNAVLEVYMSRMLVAGGVAAMTLYIVQSVNWPSTGMDFLLKVMSWF
jgi:hypothetical protein